MASATASELFLVLLLRVSLVLRHRREHRFVNLWQWLAVVVVENFGYHQLNSLWRLWGMLLWIAGSKGKWGEMTRTATWQTGASALPADRMPRS